MSGQKQNRCTRGRFAGSIFREKQFGLASRRPGMAVLLCSTSGLRDVMLRDVMLGDVMKDEMKGFFDGKQDESDHSKNDLKFF
jgi:hypothetical protein